MQSKWLVCCIGLASVTIVGCWPAPPAWSPDGHWLAHATVAAPMEFWSSADQLFPDVENGEAPPPDTVRLIPKDGHRIWVSKVDGDGSLAIENAPGPVTAPAWKPDGSALAYGRLVSDPDAPARFEMVVRGANGPAKVIAAEALAEIKPEYDRLVEVSPCWSPDGKWLAIPRLQPPGLAIVRADGGGGVSRAIDDARLPAWSPDGSRLAFVRGGDPETLHCVDLDGGSPRPLTEVGTIGQTPAWSRDGQTIMTLRARPTRRNRPAPSEPVELIRVRAETGKVAPVRPIAGSPAPDLPLADVSFAIDREGANLLYTTGAAGGGSLIVWCRPLDDVVLKRFHPLDVSVPIGALALSPTANGPEFALRVGPPGPKALAALCDLKTEKLRPIVPDDPTRLAWVRLLMETSRHLLGGDAADRADGGPFHNGAVPAAEARPTWLPLPGDHAPGGELAVRLRRLGRIGRPLCDRPPTAPPLPPAASTALAEARLAFDYLKGDFVSALAALDAFEPTVTDPDHCLRLLGVRAQLAMAVGDLQRARHAVALIRESSTRPVLQVEQVGAGYVTTPAVGPARPWPDALEARLEFLGRPAADPTEPVYEPARPGANQDPDLAPVAPFLEIEPAVRLNPFRVDEPPPATRRAFPRMKPAAPPRPGPFKAP